MKYELYILAYIYMWVYLLRVKGDSNSTMGFCSTHAGFPVAIWIVSSSLIIWRFVYERI